MLLEFGKLNGSEQGLLPLDGPYTQGPREAASMSTQPILRTVEFKLYPSASQVAVLETWLRRCCWLYNRALSIA